MLAYNDLRLGVCYFALQILQALDKICRQNNSTKPLLVDGAVIETKMSNLTEKEFLETYGEAMVVFTSYYKYSFGFKGEFNGKSIYVCVIIVTGKQIGRAHV